MIKKTALIIGASTGIGLACAKQFVLKGYDIFATYNSSPISELEQLCKEHNSKLCVAKLNINDTKNIEEVFASAFKTFSFVDTVVCNAGICAQETLLCDMENEQISNILDTNLKGTIFCNKEAVKYFLKQKHGSIVNISSIYGIYGGACETAYSASKAGIIGLTKALSQECGQFGVRVNAVAPGFIETRMTKCFDEEEKENIRLATPLQTLGKPEDVANAVFFLASDEASFITGQVLEVSGGAIKF